jgi:hypothetical protein
LNSLRTRNSRETITAITRQRTRFKRDQSPHDHFDMPKQHGDDRLFFWLRRITRRTIYDHWIRHGS